MRFYCLHANLVKLQAHNYCNPLSHLQTSQMDGNYFVVWSSANVKINRFCGCFLHSPPHGGQLCQTEARAHTQETYFSVPEKSFFFFALYRTFSLSHPASPEITCTVAKQCQIVHLCLWLYFLAILPLSTVFEHAEHILIILFTFWFDSHRRGMANDNWMLWLIRTAKKASGYGMVALPIRGD